MKSLLVLIALTLSFSANASSEFSEFFSNSFAKESINQSIEKLDEKGNRLSYNRHFIQNNCNQSIGVFFVYTKLNGEWDTSAGFYELAPGQQKYIADTRNVMYYYAAATLSGGTKWTGSTNIRLDDGSVIPMIEGRINSNDFTDWKTSFCN